MFTENLLITLIVILMIFITAFVILASLHSKQMRIYYQTQSHLLIEYAQFKHPLYIKLNELKYRIQIEKEKSKEKGDSYHAIINYYLIKKYIITLFTPIILNLLQSF